MPARILGTSLADGTWHGFGAAGWWIETGGPVTGSEGAPRTYDASLPAFVSGVSVYCPTSNYAIMGVSGADSILRTNGTQSNWCSPGSPTVNQLTISSSASYRGMIRLAAFSARAATVKLYKADGVTVLDAISMTVGSAPSSWLNWEADEPIVLSIEGSFVRYQGILFDVAARARLID